MKRLALIIAMAIALPSTARAAVEYFPPLSSQVDLSDAPADLAKPTSASGDVGEKIRVKEFLYQELKNADNTKDIGAKLTLDLIAAEGFELDIPGLENSLSVVFLPGQFRAEVTMREEHAQVAADDYPFILTLSPSADQVAIRFKSDLLKPVQPVSYQPYPSNPPLPELRLSLGVRIVVRYSWDGDADVELIDPGGLRPTLSLNTPVAIGDTGVVLEIEDAELDLSRVHSPPGLPPSWVGVKFAKLAINFVNGLDVPRVEHDSNAPAVPPEMAGITVTDFSIGSGGINGSICGNLTAVPPATLFGTSFTLERLCIAFREGSMIAGEVSGILSEFPFFEATNVRVALALALDGDFRVSLSPPDPAHPQTAIDLPIPGVLVFHVEALSIERAADLYLWKLSGKLNINAISTAPEDAIAVNGLTISSDGNVSLDGGWLPLPGKKTIDFKGFAVELSEIGFGTENPGTPDQKRWVGFSGGIVLASGFDAASRFKKLQFLWPGNGRPVDVRLSGVEVSFAKPGVVSFAGSVDFFEDAATGAEGFAGTVACNVEAIKLSLAARLVIGKADPPAGSDFPFFFLDLAANLPAGIPLFGNVSLYGLLGMFAANMEPNLVGFTTPVQWFEAHRTATNVLAPTPTVAPWKVKQGGFAVGAGVILGTTSDDGFAVNAKVALMVAMPGPIVMLQGAANIVKERGELTTGAAPNFVAIAIYDGARQQFLLNIGAFYKIENVLEVKGEAEAFFNIADPEDWHLWLGKDQPVERRITAELLSFLKGTTYYMIEPSSFKHGSSAGYDKKWKFGPLRVTLQALIAYDLAFFFRPRHVWGNVGLKGEFELKAFGAGIGLSANAILEGSSPRPYLLDGKFKVKISLPWPLPDPSATVHLHWEKHLPKPPLDELVERIAIEPRKIGTSIVPDTLSFSGDTARSSPPTAVDPATLCSPGDSVRDPDDPGAVCARPLVPLDVLLVTSFQRDTNDPSNLGYGNPFDPSSPRLDVVDETSFRYDLQGVELVQAKKTGGSLAFDTPLTDLYSTWPAVLGNASTPAGLSLRTLSRNPLDVYEGNHTLFHDGGHEGWPEWAIDQYGDDYCQEFRRTDSHQPEVIVTIMPGRKRCGTPGFVVREDFVLPPYSAFRLTIDGDVTGEPTGEERIYRSTAIFHTEGPPLELAPYVDTTVPARADRPHYRGYDLGLRFNETYLDLLYAGEEQVVAMQLVDDNDKPITLIGEEVRVHAWFNEAERHIRDGTEASWWEFLVDQGIAVDQLRDDRLSGRVNLAEALRGGQSYRARVWLQDDRLAGDRRLSDAAWLFANPVRYHAGNRVMLYEYPVLMSRFATFSELVDSYPGTYVDRNVTATANLAQLATLSASAHQPYITLPSTLDNDNGDALGRYLRHVFAPRGPDEVTIDERNAWLRRAPNYADDPTRMTAAQEQALLASWRTSLDAFAAIEAALGLEVARQPLPSALEIRALVRAGIVVGLLIESPEGLDPGRISLSVEPLAGTATAANIVFNRDGNRAFVFLPSGASVLEWTPGVYLLRIAFHRVVGERQPALLAPDGATAELSVVTLDLPGDRFSPP